MKFKKGNKVEVLRRTKEQCGSWFPCKIVLVDRDQYIVRYELFLNLEGEPVVEKACGEDVRPHPPPRKEDERWGIGDMVEVFDLHCWRSGRVVKVLRNNRFVIKLFGSIQLKQFHQSSIRINQSWKNNKWVIIEKVGSGKEHDKGILDLDTGSAQPDLPGEVRSTAKDGQEHLKPLPEVRILKRNRGCHFESSLNTSDAEFGYRKRRATANVSACVELPMRTLAFSKQRDPASSPKADIGANTGKICRIGSSKMDVQKEKTNNISSHPLSIALQISEESNKCSVASCSSNEFQEYNFQNSKKSYRDVTGSSFDDAESFCPSFSRKKHLEFSTEDELEADVRKLELHAYEKTLQALYASGPLSWEQESLLTNLRLSLHISNEGRTLVHTSIIHTLSTNNSVQAHTFLSMLINNSMGIVVGKMASSSNNPFDSVGDSSNWGYDQQHLYMGEPLNQWGYGQEPVGYIHIAQVYPCMGLLQYVPEDVYYYYLNEYLH